MICILPIGASQSVLLAAYNKMIWSISQPWVPLYQLKFAAPCSHALYSHLMSTGVHYIYKWICLGWEKGIGKPLPLSVYRLLVPPRIPPCPQNKLTHAVCPPRRARLHYQHSLFAHLFVPRPPLLYRPPPLLKPFFGTFTRALDF